MTTPMTDVTQADREAAALVALTQHGFTADIMEVLVRGNPSLRIPPGGLTAALNAVRSPDTARIAALEDALRGLQITAERVSNKYGRDDLDELSDWTEWVDLRAAIASATTALGDQP